MSSQNAQNQQWIVRTKTYGIHFHRNHCGKVFSFVDDKDATRFSDQAKARAAAIDQHLTDYTIEPANN